MYGKWLIGLVAWGVCTVGFAATAPKPASVKIKVNIDGPNPATPSGRTMVLTMVAAGVAVQDAYAAGNSYQLRSLTPDLCDTSQNIDGFNRMMYYSRPLGQGVCRVSVELNLPKYVGRAEVSYPVVKGTQEISARGYTITKNKSTAFDPRLLSDGKFVHLEFLAPPGETPVLTNESPAICTTDLRSASVVVGGTYYQIDITPLAVGDCSMTLSRPEGAGYVADGPYPMVQPIVAGSGGKIIQTITLCAPTPIVLGKTGSPCFSTNATTGLYVISQTFDTCTTPAVGSQDGSGKALITGVKAGTCKVLVSAASTALRAGAAEYQSISIVEADKINQTITFDAAPALTVGSAAKISASGGASGSPVLFTSKTPKVCSVSGDQVSALEVGLCTVAADQAGDDRYNAAAQVTLDINVASAGKIEQKITFGATSTLILGASAKISAVGGGSGNPVIFASQTTDTCTISDDVVSGIAAGSCIITANQAGSATYDEAKEAKLVLSVATSSKTAQTIRFVSPPSLDVGGTATITTIGGESSKPVTLSSQTAAICTMDGSTVTGVAEGTCIIAAIQEGDDQYEPAAETTQKITVVKEISPYAISVSVLGDINAQTLTAQIKPASDDLGKDGNLFVGARLGGSIFLLGAAGWVPYEKEADVVAFFSGVLEAKEVTLVDNLDLTPLNGAQIFVGYGRGLSLSASIADMLAANRMFDVYDVK